MAGQNNNNFGVGTVNVVNAGAIQINQIYSHGATHIKAASARVSELGLTAAHRYQGIIDSIAGICQVLGGLCPLYDPVLTPLHSVMTNLHGIVGYVVNFLSVIDEAPDISKLGHFDRVRRFLIRCSSRLHRLSQDLLAYNQYIHPLNCAGFWRGICLFVFAHFRWGTPIRNLQNFVMSHQIPLEQFSRFFESRSWDTIIKGQMGVRLEKLVRASALLQTPSPTTLQPLKLTVMNHLGDYLSIPLEFCSSLEDIRIVIKHWCRDQPGDNFIRSDSWELVHPESNKSIDRFMFPRLAKPQTVFAMSIVLGRRGLRPYHCPNCGEDNRHQARDNGWVNCSDCYLLFTVLHESPPKHNPSSSDVSEKIIRDKIPRYALSAPERFTHQIPAQPLPDSQPAIHNTPQPTLKYEDGTQSQADPDHRQDREPIYPGNVEKITEELIFVADVSRFKRVTIRIHQVQTTPKRKLSNPQIFQPSQKYEIHNQVWDTKPQLKNKDRLHTRLYKYLRMVRLEPQKPSDIVVLLGPTGAGKSTFGNFALGDDVFKTGGSLSCCTNDAQIQACKSPTDGRQVLIIDTPAFNHDTLSIGDIEAKVKKLLKKKKTFHVTGILYLHRISDVRLNENPARHLRMFEELCGPQPAQKIILATTMWGNMNPEVGLRREDELREQWRPFISQGSCIKRFQDTQESSWEIIDRLLEQSHTGNQNISHV